jgi:hypothetical protein
VVYGDREADSRGGNFEIDGRVTVNRMLLLINIGQNSSTFRTALSKTVAGKRSKFHAETDCRVLYL